MGEWRLVSLNDICTFQAGDAFSKDKQGQRSGDVPFIKVSDMNLSGNEHYIRTANNWLTKDEAGGYYIHPKGAVVFAKIGEALKANRRRILLRPTIIDNNMMSASAKKNINHHWFFYLLQTIDFNEVSRGSALPYLAVSDLKKIQLQLPEPSTQDAIASTLSSLDDKIDLNRRMNETLEAMAQTIFRDWFVDFGPVRRKLAGITDPVAIMGGLTPDPARAAELAALFPDRFGEDDLPIKWNHEAVLDQASWINGAAYKKMHFVPSGEGLPVIKIAELKAGVTASTGFTNTDLGSRYLIDNGELLFSWSGNPDTSIDAFIWAGGPAWLNQHIFAVRPNGSRSLGFLFAMLKFLKPTFAEIARDKQTTGLGHVTKEDLQRLQVVVPTKGVEAAFDKLITPLFDKILTNLLENRTLAETRDYLLPRLMSGEVRVGDVAQELAA